MESFVYVYSCLLPELWSLKCQKWLIFVFSADNNKKLVALWVHLKDLIEFFQKMALLIGSVTVRSILRVEISKKLLSQQRNKTK